jgi:hypothetical protein
MSEKCHNRKRSGLFDHLVGAAEQRWQDLAAELFFRLAVRSIISGYSMFALPPRKRADKAPIKSLPQE